MLMMGGYMQRDENDVDKIGLYFASTLEYELAQKSIIIHDDIIDDDLAQLFDQLSREAYEDELEYELRNKS